MTPEEFRESAARAMEEMADLASVVLFQDPGPTPDELALQKARRWAIRETWKHAAEIVRSHPVASPDRDPVAKAIEGSPWLQGLTSTPEDRAEFEREYAAFEASEVDWERSHPVASPWIPVEERLPERGQEVLCWCQVYQTLGGLNWDGEWEDRWFRAIYPNLWMPIPPTEPTS